MNLWPHTDYYHCARSGGGGAAAVDGDCDDGDDGATATTVMNSRWYVMQQPMPINYHYSYPNY